MEGRGEGRRWGGGGGGGGGLRGRAQPSTQVSQVRANQFQRVSFSVSCTGKEESGNAP